MSAKKKTKPAKSPAAKPSPTSNPMDLGLIENMVALMSTHDLSAIEVRDGDRRIVLRRGAQMVSAPAATYAPAPVAAAPAPAKAASSDPASTPPTPAPDADAGLLKITSPMVGTFYAAPSPDAKPFVQVGSQVDEDSDVCVIEAMKVFNSIKAECRGKIAKVLVTNGSTVEFGQVLFLVKP